MSIQNTDLSDNDGTEADKFFDQLALEDTLLASAFPALESANPANIRKACLHAFDMPMVFQRDW